MTNEEFMIKVRGEIKEYLTTISGFSKMAKEEDQETNRNKIVFNADEIDSSEIKDVFLAISSFSARANFFKVQVASLTDPKMVLFVENELDPFIKELEFQFRVWSRYEAVLSREWEMIK